MIENGLRLFESRSRPQVDGVDALGPRLWNASRRQPLYLAHAADDPTNDVRNSEFVFSNYTGPVKLRIFEGANHDLPPRDRDVALAEAVAFLGENGAFRVVDAPGDFGPPRHIYLPVDSCPTEFPCAASSSRGANVAVFMVVAWTVAAAAAALAAAFGICYRRLRRPRAPSRGAAADEVDLEFEFEQEMLVFESAGEKPVV